MASLDEVEKCRLLKEVPREDFPKLVQILMEYVPSSLCVQGYILQSLNSRALLDCRVYVDVWPGSPQVYIVEILSYRRNPSEENINLLPICGFAVCDKLNLKHIIKSDHFLNRYFSGENSSEHNGSHFSFLELGQEVPRAAVNVTSCASICALLEPKNLAKSSEPNGYQLGSLRKKDVPFISKLWEYSRDETTVKRLNSLIENSITAGWYKEDDLVSWVFVMEYGGMGLLNTLPAHRNKGLAKSLIYHVSQKLLADGRIPYCFIVKDNEVSQKLFSKMGFQYFMQFSVAFFVIKSKANNQPNKM